MTHVRANLVLLLAALAIPTFASAQERSESLAPVADGIRIGGGLVTGFGGTVRFDLDGSLLDYDDAMVPSIGFGLYGEYAFLRYVAVGLSSTLVWWNHDDVADADIGRSFVWTLDAHLKGRYPFALGALGAEAYLLVPLGLTLSAPNGDYPNDPNTTAGFNIAIMGGFALFFTDQIGAFTEIGWQWHFLQHELQVGMSDVGVRVGQLRWTLGVVVAL